MLPSKFNYYSPLRSLLFALPPEAAHSLTLNALTALDTVGLVKAFVKTPPPLPVQVMGLNFSSPVGIAAGLDKDARHLGALQALGCGFIEVGSVTPEAQPGNPLPRLFRLPEHEALINRMGFNSAGLESVAERLASHNSRCIIGVNLGLNKGRLQVENFAVALQRIHHLADYVAINLSSPNTPGLRDLQQTRQLADLLDVVFAAREQLLREGAAYFPLVVKLSADLEPQQLVAVAEVLRSYHIDAVIAFNTSTARDEVADSALASEQGGLSGRPLETRALNLTWQLVEALGSEVPVIASGGIHSPAAAARRVAAGATLVQLYTGLIYRGPGMIYETVEAIRSQVNS